METKRRRKQELKERKNYLPTLGVILILWLSLAWVIFFIDPSLPWAVPVFFFILLGASSFTLSILFGNTRRGILSGIFITCYLILRVLGLDTTLNIVLLAGGLTAFEVYFSRKV